MEIERNEEMHLPSLEEKRSTLPLSFHCHLNILRSPILSVDGEDDDEEEKKYIDHGSQIGPHFLRRRRETQNEPTGKKYSLVNSKGVFS